VLSSTQRVVPDASASSSASASLGEAAAAVVAIEPRVTAGDVVRRERRLPGAGHADDHHDLAAARRTWRRASDRHVAPRQLDDRLVGQHE